MSLAGMGSLAPCMGQLCRGDTGALGGHGGHGWDRVRGRAGDIALWTLLWGWRWDWVGAGREREMEWSGCGNKHS